MIRSAMRIAFLDCCAGVAGDMWVGALLDAGLPLARLQAAVDSLGLPGVAVDARPVRRAGLAGTKFEVVGASAGGGAGHRGIGEIRGLIEGAAVPAAVREAAVEVFVALAEVESAAHGVAVDEVHFHELGAVDTVVDVLCACLGVRELGIERLYASAVEVGSGTVRCEHGVLPVPAPGTAGLLVGVPVTRGMAGERTTPTGAALLRVLCDGFEPRLCWTPERVGHGAGTRDDPDIPNLLRVTIGRSGVGAGAEGVLEVSCNLDSVDGETLGWLIDGLLCRGALDAWATPVTMKKGRPGYVVSALMAERERSAVVGFLLEESTTLGVRLVRMERDVLERWVETRETAFGPMRFKCARLPSGRETRRVEDDDLRQVCARTGIGRREVLARITGGAG